MEWNAEQWTGVILLGLGIWGVCVVVILKFVGAGKD